MYRKIPTILLFLVSFLLITIGGYQCATQVTDTGRVSIPIATEVLNTGGINTEPSRDDGYVRSGQLPPEPDSGCPRSQYRDWEDSYGSIGTFRFDSSSFDDFSFGKVSNFPPKCGRIFLQMRSAGKRTYKGKLVLAYAAGNQIHRITFDSGRTDEENKYNKWDRNSWRADRRNRVSKDFHAIFEDEHAAVILKMEDVRVKNVRDQSDVYLGAGEVYYKMFRVYGADTSDVCYNHGTYVKDAHTPPRKSGRCWFLTTGPFSCRPAGVLNPGSKFTDINITEDLPCYERLGEFFNLEIAPAFGEEDVDDI